MRSIETRIAEIEAVMSPLFPQFEKPQIVYAVLETDSALEREVKKQKAIAEYEWKNGVEVDLANVKVVPLRVVYRSKRSLPADDCS